MTGYVQNQTLAGAQAIWLSGRKVFGAITASAITAKLNYGTAEHLCSPYPKSL